MAVEAAVALPLLVVVILGILQLTLAQQARLMLEYAAYSAARAGSVANADPEPMRTAATLALLPTFPSASARSLGALTGAERVAAALGAQLRPERAEWGPLGAPPIAVDLLSPGPEDFGDGEEIDFDDAGESLAERRRTQLTVRVTYDFELRIPVANWLIFESWYLAKTGVRLFRGERFGVPAPAAGPPPAAQACSGGVEAATLQRLGSAAARGRYFLPLATTWTLRMQSNAFRKHARGAHGC